jgi:hypothetical protein
LNGTTIKRLNPCQRVNGISLTMERFTVLEEIDDGDQS